MPKQVPQDELDALIRAVADFQDGGALVDIANALEIELPRRTLQRRLALLVEEKRLVVEGGGRGSRYRLPAAIPIDVHDKVRAADSVSTEQYVPISNEAENVKRAVRESIQNRRPIGYDRAFLDAYRPNETFYLSE